MKPLKVLRGLKEFNAKKRLVTPRKIRTRVNDEMPWTDRCRLQARATSPIAGLVNWRNSSSGELVGEESVRPSENTKTKCTSLGPGKLYQQFRFRSTQQ